MEKRDNLPFARGFHVTTAIHDSRTSDRMLRYRVRERRFGGKKPFAEVFPMCPEQEELIAKTIAQIAEELKLHIAAFNICRDHMHLLLICNREEVPRIMHRIKGRTARVCNIAGSLATASGNKGINPLVAGCAEIGAGGSPDYSPHGQSPTMLKDGSRPFWTQKYGCKAIKSEKQLFNTIRYIQTNREKHRLPPNEKLKYIIQTIVKNEDSLSSFRENSLRPGGTNRSGKE